MRRQEQEESSEEQERKGVKMEGRKRGNKDLERKLYKREEQERKRGRGRK